MSGRRSAVAPFAGALFDGFAVVMPPVEAMVALYEPTIAPAIAREIGVHGRARGIVEADTERPAELGNEGRELG